MDDRKEFGGLISVWGSGSGTLTSFKFVFTLLCCHLWVALSGRSLLSLIRAKLNTDDGATERVLAGGRGGEKDSSFLEGTLTVPQIIKKLTWLVEIWG